MIITAYIRTQDDAVISFVYCNQSTSNTLYHTFDMSGIQRHVVNQYASSWIEQLYNPVYYYNTCASVCAVSSVRGHAGKPSSASLY